MSGVLNAMPWSLSFCVTVSLLRSQSARSCVAASVRIWPTLSWIGSGSFFHAAS